ncbi:MAG: glycosyltransferase N-terminal domain-containing protein [Ginsengibacter sp.]
MILFYQIFLFLYKAGIYFVSFWNPKARLWITGRRNIFEKLRDTVQHNVGKRTIWMHCASLGEFEQGRPVLQKIKEENPDTSIVITFFSPSGYEIVKNKKNFENIFYLPMDSFFHAKKWMNILKPDLVLWVKYEYWHYYLQEIKNRHIPLLMISGVYRSNSIFFKWYGSFYRNMLNCFTHFFVQNENSKEQLQKMIAEEKITVSGDTRCDRVINIAENFTEVPYIKDFCGSYRVIVLGSTWEDDEAVWIHFVKKHPEIKFIIAPHEIDAENLSDVKKEFPHSVFYSDLIKSNQIPDEAERSKSFLLERSEDPNCLIIDNIGTLSRLYHYATITYVGGGFGDDGLHNILEAAVYGKPVLFGPEYDKNFEAKEMIDCSGAISIESALELEKILGNLLNDEKELLTRSNAAKEYVYQNAGATQRIIAYISK